MEKKTPQEFIGTKLMYENATIFSIRENGHCQPIVDLRGFGAIQNLFKDNSGKVNYDAACEFQDSVGEHIKAAIESYERLVKENEELDKAALSWKETSEKLSEAVNEYREETERLQSENERMRELLKEIELDYSKEANEYHMMNLTEQSKFWSDKADEINNVLNPK